MPRGRPRPIAAFDDAIRVACVQKEVRVLELEVAAPPKEDLLVALGIDEFRPLLLHEKKKETAPQAQAAGRHANYPLVFG